MSLGMPGFSISWAQNGLPLLVRGGFIPKGFRFVLFFRLEGPFRGGIGCLREAVFILDCGSMDQIVGCTGKEGWISRTKSNSSGREF